MSKNKHVLQTPLKPFAKSLQHCTVNKKPYLNISFQHLTAFKLCSKVV